MDAHRGRSGDVAIVGAGIIGLAIAFELASRGAGVHVYDAGEPGRAASWAAAGMLAPRTERIGDCALAELCQRSLDLYPEFVRAVTAAGGIDPHLQLDGILHAAYSIEGCEELRRRAREWQTATRSASLLSRADMVRAEPALGKDVCGGMLVDGEGTIDNRRLGRALIAACEARGVRIHTRVERLTLDFDSRRVLGIYSDLGYMAAGAVVNAAGAWAAELEGVPSACVPPVRPVKGQMLALALPAGLVRRPIWVPGAYLVPRNDGRLLVGATSEEGDDVRVTAGGIHVLLDAALRAAPALRDFTVTETWAGLRPATPDGRPCLGPSPRLDYYLATGHYRNGILLAPITARLLAQAMEGDVQCCTPFELGRFSTKAEGQPRMLTR